MDAAPARSGCEQGEPRPGRGDTALPSLARQKSFVVENAGILDPETKKVILRLVMMEVGRTAPARPGGGVARTVVLEHGATREVSINLDAIDNEEVILQLYNIVCNRRAALNEPMRDTLGSLARMQKA